MTIRDRGKIKWQSASFIPLVFEMTSEMFKYNLGLISQS